MDSAVEARVAWRHPVDSLGLGVLAKYDKRLCNVP